MAPTTPKSKFSEGEKVLCYHGPLLYEAKCVKTKKDGGTLMYFVHYLGWNKNWDEWVNETRILKITPENLEKKVAHNCCKTALASGHFAIRVFPVKTNLTHIDYCIASQTYFMVFALKSKYDLISKNHTHIYI
jgi:hypothetical protein